MILPIVGKSEVIPLRLIPYVTDPAVSQRLLLDHLYNCRGDYCPELHARTIGNPFATIKAVDWRNMSDQKMDGFPAGRFIRKKVFEAYCKRVQLEVDGERVKLRLSNEIPDDILKIALEGFELVNVSEVSQQKPDSKSLLKVILGRTADRLYRASNKFPTYRDVLKALNSSANEDGEIGALINTANLSGVELPDGTIMTVKTIQNWLTAYKKTLPELNK